MGAGIPQRTVSSCTPTATGRSIAKRWMWHHRVPQGAFERLELLEGKLCAAGRGAASLTESRGVRRETPGSSTHLKAKAGGDKSLSEKREAREGVYRVVLRDPRDTVRAVLPEPQSPAVELHTRRDHAWLRRHHERTDKLSRCVLFAWWAMCSEHIEGDEWGTYVALERSAPPER